jgi:hypothetical protein
MEPTQNTPEKSKTQDAVKHSHYVYCQYGRGPSSPMPHVIHYRHHIILVVTIPEGGRLTTRTNLELGLTLSRQFILLTCTAARCHFGFGMT